MASFITKIMILWQLFSKPSFFRKGMFSSFVNPYTRIGHLLSKHETEVFHRVQRLVWKFDRWYLDHHWKFPERPEFVVAKCCHHGSYSNVLLKFSPFRGMFAKIADCAPVWSAPLKSFWRRTSLLQLTSTPFLALFFTIVAAGEMK